MTVSYDRLVGTFEELDEVIRYNLETNWTNTNVNNGSENLTPDFSSATGSSVSHAWFDNTSFGVNGIVVNSDSEFPDPSGRFIGDYGQKMNQLIYIDIQAESYTVLKLMMREVDRIIWEILPSGNTTIPKSDTTASHIHSFEENSVDWNIPKTENSVSKDNIRAAGTLTVNWFKTKS